MQYEINLPISIYKLDKHNNIKKELLDSINTGYSLCMLDHKDKIFRTDWNVDSQIERNYLKLFTPCLIDLLTTIKPKYWCTGFQIHNVWFQQYRKDDIHDWHNHPASQFSAVYYLDLKNNLDSTEFYHLENDETFQLDNKEGDIMIFPSFIYHRSPSLKSETKTVISFNFSWT